MARIQVLPPETARLIAAGEVIDRPAAVLRELLDNAIDAGASDIRVEIEAGGIASLAVVDDGSGMEAEDLGLSILPHATSKIRSADDLLSATSLGFRGEALASIAAAAELEITTRTEEMREARRLLALPGLPPSMEATHGSRGTRVRVSRLFDNYPARRQFLKRSQAEAALCRQVFVDKARANPGIGFRFSSEGRLLDLAPASPSFKERALAFDAEPGEALLHEIGFSGEGFRGRILLSGPAWYRGDRRAMEVFVNRRRVQDWGLLSGLDWAFEGFLPGGAHPYARLFLEVEPALADFNIHPAKREVRFRDPGSIRHAMTVAMRDFLGELVRAHPGEARPEPFAPGLFGPGQGAGSAEPGPAGPGEEAGARGPEAGGAVSWAGYGGGYPRGGARGFGAAGAERPGAGREAWAELLRERPLGPPAPRGEGSVEAEEGIGPGPGSGPRLRYLGRAFGLFLVVERGEELFLIDQHAAHERLIFDELSAKPPAVQELLVPLPLPVETEAEAARMAGLAEALAPAGFRLEPAGGDWQLTALPASLREDPEGALREVLAGGGADPARSARAMTACRAAVKDGDELDPVSALELARRALGLPEPRCPHGRPVWVRLTREELFRLVRRLV